MLVFLVFFATFDCMKAMILAAGLGTRLKPFTDKHPKALAPIGETTLLALNIQKLIKYGITDIVINVHHFADQIIQYLEEHQCFGANIRISDERSEVLETGGGLKKALPLLDNTSDILVCNVDILSNINYHNLLTYHLSQKADVTLAVQQRSSSRQLLFDASHQLYGWTNTLTSLTRPADLQLQPQGSMLAFSGIQILKKSFCDAILLEGKFSLIDVYLNAMQQHKILAFDHTNDVVLDVGKPEALEKAATLPILQW